MGLASYKLTEGMDDAIEILISHSTTYVEDV